MNEHFTNTFLIAFYILDIANKYNIDILNHLGLDRFLNHENSILEYIYFENGELNLPFLERISEILGLTIDEIISCDEDAKYRYYKKYKWIFEVIDEYNNAISEASKNAPKGSEVVIDYWKLSVLLFGITEICSAYKEFFLTSIYQELPEEKILEMNFLAHFLEVTDIFIPNSYLTYEIARKRRELYKKEVMEYDIRSIIIFKKLLDFKPWKCIQFAGNILDGDLMTEINVCWHDEFCDWIYKLKDGVKYHFCFKNATFDSEVELIDGFYSYSQAGEDSVNYEEKILKWIDNLQLTEKLWTGSTDYDVFFQQTMSSRIRCQRINKRKLLIM